MDAGSLHDMAYNRSVIPLAQICKTCPHANPRTCDSCKVWGCSECHNNGTGCTDCDSGPIRRVPFGFIYEMDKPTHCRLASTKERIVPVCPHESSKAAGTITKAHCQACVEEYCL